MKKYTDKDWLLDMYVTKELSCASIAKLCDVSLGLIHRYLVSFGIPRRKFEGRGGTKCSRWGGGRTRSKVGYIWIHIDEPHIHQISARHKYVPEQILVVEDVIGRLLTKEETVHHINEVKDDNRPENLYLFPSESAHQRYHQKLRKGSGEPITLSNIL